MSAHFLPKYAALQQSGQTGVKQSAHVAAQFIIIFYNGFDMP
jgi:hypothetical protein